MNISELKEYIYNNKKVKFVLENIRNHNIIYHSSSGLLNPWFTCSNFDGDNTNAVKIEDTKYLNVTNYTRPEFNKLGKDGRTDIVTLTMYNKNINFKDALKYLHELLGLPYDGKYSGKHRLRFQPLEQFNNELCENSFDFTDFTYIDPNKLNKYEDALHIDWLREGIIEKTRAKFGIKFEQTPNGKYDCIIIPLRAWFNGKTIDVKRRIVNNDLLTTGYPKYIDPSGYPQKQNIYGLWENYESIKNKGYCVVFEGEKSVLKRDSLTDATGVAIGGHSLSDTQADILASLNVEVVIAFDEGISIAETRFNCEKLYGRCKVSYIFDKWDKLGKKESPADIANKDYQYLFDNRVRYDKAEHEQYLKDINN